jgi:snRNA-activating protein complex subunit 4
MLPYLPPTLCSLRVLSSLLLCKKALEHKAVSLVASRAAGARPEPQAGTLQALLGVVQRQLQDNPAYLLLKTRFLAAFTLPALLATLSPCGVHTTLSAIRVGPESEDEDLLGELGLEDKVRQLGCTSSRMQVATSPIQVRVLVPALIL